MWMSYLIPEPLRQAFRCVNCLWPRQNERGQPPLPRDQRNWPHFLFRWRATWERQFEEWNMQRYNAAQPAQHQNDSASSHTATEQQDGPGWHNESEIPRLELPRPLSWGSGLFYPFSNGSIETVLGKDEDSQPTVNNARLHASGFGDPAVLQTKHAPGCPQSHTNAHQPSQAERQAQTLPPVQTNAHDQKPDSPYPQTNTNQPSQAERHSQTLPSVQQEQTNTHDQKPASPRPQTNTRQPNRAEQKAPTLEPIQEEQEAQPDVTNQRRPRPEMDSPPATFSRNSVFEMANLQFQLERVLAEGYDADTEKE